jgi:AAA+ ATPase superfamily predicted ATPase
MNPFVYNSPVRGKDFFNREKTVEKILKETVTGKSQGNIWITGERQIGKTSLLRHMQSLNENYSEKVQPYGSDKSFNVAFIFANVQGCSDEDSFYATLRQSLKDYFDFKITKAANGYEDFIKAIDVIYNTKNYYVIFLIDEFDAFIETIAFKKPHSATKFLAKLSSLLQEVDEVNGGAKAFSCVFTANRDIKELLNENHIDNRGSGLIVEAVTLKWFTKKQVSELADLYLRDNKIKFTAAEIELCFGATQGYPYFTQKMLSLMYDAKKNVLSEKEYAKLVKDEFGEMFKETIEDWGGDKMPMRTLKKLKDLAEKMNLADTVTKVIAKMLELYIKSKMGI